MKQYLKRGFNGECSVSLLHVFIISLSHVLNSLHSGNAWPIPSYLWKCKGYRCFQLEGKKTQIEFMGNKSSKAIHSNLLSDRILKVTFNTTIIWINLIHFKTFKVIKTLQRDLNHVKTYIGQFSHYCDKILDKKQLQGGRYYFGSWFQEIWSTGVEKSWWQTVHARTGIRTTI